ncbi:hypothetical protein GGX14DRAFT_565245 [Mycena pura]|uniref:BTB domain-containing protein n=1 Tax=Mycena pura TaxID=153505 RepID=A0AAD6VFG7_9AGAR|nr:hypothetical protein GGX14DRAFT_565245 [Mycena pura]
MGTGRHPQLYFEDGTMTIKASDGTLYNVYRAPLIRQSEFCSAMLTLPNPKQPPLSLTQNAREWFERSRQLGLEGTSDATALPLPEQFTPSEIEKFLDFMFLQPWSPNAPSIDTACAILKLSHFLVVDNGISYARHHLDNHEDLKAVMRLKLGFDYHFVDWITRGFDELVATPIIDLSAEEETLIGWIAYRALARAQAEVLDARLNLAVARIPDVNHCNWCSNHSNCQSEWARMWTSVKGVLGALIKEELPGSEILEKLSTYNHGAMNVECHRRTCDGLKDTEEKVSILREEEAIIDKHATELMRQLGIA